MPEHAVQLVTLERHLDLSEALVVHSFLKAHGFCAVLPDEYFLRVHWLRLFALGGASIQVPDAEADEARALLRDIRSEPADPQSDKPRDLKRRLALLLVLLSG